MDILRVAWIELIALLTLLGFYYLDSNFAEEDLIAWDLEESLVLLVRLENLELLRAAVLELIGEVFHFLLRLSFYFSFDVLDEFSESTFLWFFFLIG